MSQRTSFISPFGNILFEAIRSIVASYLIGFIHASVSFIFVPRFMGFAALIVTLIVMIYRRGGIFAGETLW